VQILVNSDNHIVLHRRLSNFVDRKASVWKPTSLIRGVAITAPPLALRPREASSRRNALDITLAGRSYLGL
jgi:hypothetical protein